MPGPRQTQSILPASDNLAAVLAVKGPLRRFAPVTAPGRRENKILGIGKRGLRVSGFPEPGDQGT
jgi:hypothetical protein